MTSKAIFVEYWFDLNAVINSVCPQSTVVETDYSDGNQCESNIDKWFAQDTLLIEVVNLNNF